VPTSCSATRTSKGPLLQQAYEDQNQHDDYQGCHRDFPELERLAAVVSETPPISSAPYSFALCSLAVGEASTPQPLTILP
jgi:hypothetical protein